MKSILDPSFKYVPSAHTDIRKTFDRERKRLAREQTAAPAAVDEENPPLQSDVQAMPLRRIK